MVTDHRKGCNFYEGDSFVECNTATWRQCEDFHLAFSLKVTTN